MTLCRTHRILPVSAWPEVSVGRLSKQHCPIYLSSLERAHGYKDKIARGLPANFGPFSYSVLMAARISSFSVPTSQHRWIADAGDRIQSCSRVRAALVRRRLTARPNSPHELSLAPQAPACRETSCGYRRRDIESPKSPHRRGFPPRARIKHRLLECDIRLPPDCCAGEHLRERHLGGVDDAISATSRSC